MPPLLRQGNAWFGTYTDVAARNGNLAQDVNIAQRFDIDPNDLTFWPRSNNAFSWQVAGGNLNQHWFFPLLGVTQLSCALALPEGDGNSYKNTDEEAADSLDVLDQSIIADSISFTNYEDPLRWKN